MKFKSDVDVEAALAVSGDVGVGTTSPSFGTGGGLQISNAAQSNLRFTDTSNATFITDLALSNENFYLINRSASGSLKFRVNSSDEALTILSSGNVGIGITAPTSKLHVIGQDVTFYSGTGNQSLQVGRFVGERTEIYVDDLQHKITAINDADNNDAHKFILNRAFLGTGANTFQIQKDGTAQLLIDGNGNVGIGTTAPTYKLDVNSATARIGSSTQTTTTLYLTATNTAGAPAIATEIIMQGYEGRAMGTFYTDTGVAGEEWFNGMPYSGDLNRFQIGYDASGGQAEYLANSLFDLYYNGRLTLGNYGAGAFTGTTAYALGVTSTGAVIELEGGDLPGGPYLPLAGGTMDSGATINMSGTLTIDGSSSVKMLVKGGARIALENANSTDSFYIANTGGNLASVLDLGSTLTIAENGGVSTFAGDVKIAEASNKGQLFFGTANTDYEIKGGGNYGYISLNAPILRFDTGGSERMRINSSGNVGIGTTAPSTKFHVRNGEATIASDTDGVKLSYSSGNSSGIIDTAFSDNNLEFRTNGTAKMWIANGGNVGIGTTTPNQLLHVRKTNAPAGIEIKGGLTTITAVGDVHSFIDFGANDASTTGGIAGRIESVTESSNGAHNGLAFYTGRQSRTPYLQQALFITSLGGISFGSGSTAYGTSGQVLQSNGNAAPTWVTANTGDITNVSTTSPITGGGSSGSVTIAHANSGVTAGSYARATVTVDATGHVTSISANSDAQGVTSVATGNGISGGTITSTGTLTVGAGDGLSQSSTGLLVDSTVVRTTGAQSIGGVKTFTSNTTFNGYLRGSGQQLVLNGGESYSVATGQTNELVYLNAESGIQINSSPDNWSSGWAGRKTTTINDSSGNSTFANDITVSGGDITLGGTGRIQGIDTVSSTTDAANKAYVDAGDARVTPATPSTITSSVVGETIEIVFNQSATSNIDYYQVWSSDDGGDYGIIAQVTPADFSSTMTVVDTTFVTGGTMSYRIFAVREGIYSTAGTTSQSYTVGALDVFNMTVVNLNTAYYIQYEKPTTRFIDHIEIYMDSQTTSAALNRSNATIVYSGQNSSYMRNVNASNNFHQFWVEIVTS